MKIALRALEPEDATMVFMWENDRTLWQYGRIQAPLSLHQIRQYIDSYTDDIFAAGQLRLVITVDGTPAGMADLYEIDALNRRAGIGIMVAAAYRRQGVAAQALTLMLEYAGMRLGLHQLWAVCAATNEGSVELFKSAGFAINGRLRSWLRTGASYTDAYFLQHLLVP